MTSLGKILHENKLIMSTQLSITEHKGKKIRTGGGNPQIPYRLLAEVVYIQGVQQLGKVLSVLFVAFFLPRSQFSPLAIDSTSKSKDNKRQFKSTCLNFNRE